jgi:predicted MFS family arabinose efflux permease
VANVWALSKLPMVGGTFKSDNSPLADIKELLSYLRRKPILIALLLLVLARAWFYMPYRTYMPKYSDDVLGFDATGLGLLLAAPSIGSLISSLIVASLGDFQGKGKLLIVAGFVTGLSLILWSNAAWFPLVFFGLMVMGAAGNATMVTNNTLMQTNSEPRLRGRVMSAYMMAWGLTPLSTIPLGALADKLGVSFVVTTMGVLLIVFFAGVLFWQSRIQKLP